MSTRASILAAAAFVMMGTNHVQLPPAPHPQRTMPNPPRPRRLSAVEAQRDTLLDALKLARSIIGHPDDAHSQMIDAAIKAVEGEQK